MPLPTTTCAQAVTFGKGLHAGIIHAGVIHVHSVFFVPTQCVFVVVFLCSMYFVCLIVFCAFFCCNFIMFEFAIQCSHSVLMLMLMLALVLLLVLVLVFVLVVTASGTGLFADLCMLTCIVCMSAYYYCACAC